LDRWRAPAGLSGVGLHGSAVGHSAGRPAGRPAGSLGGGILVDTLLDALLDALLDDSNSTTKGSNVAGVALCDR